MCFDIHIYLKNLGRVSHFTLSPLVSSGCFPDPNEQPPIDPNAWILEGNWDDYIEAFTNNFVRIHFKGT